MPLGRSYGIALVGLTGHLIEVEADIGQTLPAFVLLGLPDASLQEAKDRIRSAAQNSGLPLSRRKITVNLVPATLPKRGSSFDLAIVMAAWRAAGDVRSPQRAVFIAELGLDGRLRPVPGVLPAVMAAVQAGHPDVVVAAGNGDEARLVPGARVRSFGTLAEVALAFGADPRQLLLAEEAAAAAADVPEAGDFGLAAAMAKLAPGTAGTAQGMAQGTAGAEAVHSPSHGAAAFHDRSSTPGITAEDADGVGQITVPDMADVAGQADARLALEVAAAGGHHVLLLGPPGAGKTMLAERLPGLLPDLDDAAAMEVTAIHSLGSVAKERVSLIRRPPFESPHHSSTTVAIIGGGTGIPRPGAASRAHRGVLFLDEAPEYERGVLDALRQPLESGQLVIQRAAGTAVYPARFQLLLAANPCPCGRASAKGINCTCTPHQRRQYFARISGPLLDRVDLQLSVPRVSYSEFSSASRSESTASIAARVAAARIRQRERLADWGCLTNAEVPGKVLRRQLRLDRSVTASLDRALERETLTGRGYDRVLRVAWTLADLIGRSAPGEEEVGKALAFRQQVAAQ